MATYNGRGIVQETAKGQEDELKERIQELENELTQSQSLCNLWLKRYHNKCIENSNLRGEMKEVEELNDEQEQKMENLQNKLDAVIERLQQEGVCDRNCVLRAIYWICEKKLPSVKVDCYEQLGKILTHHVGEKIENETDFKCEYFMNILIKCEIAHEIYKDEESYTPNIIDGAWEKLMNMGEGLCLFGIKIQKAIGGGHCLICDLDTEKKNQSVMVHDRTIWKQLMNKGYFKNWLNDLEVEGLVLYAVNLQKLEEIIHKELRLGNRRKQTAVL